MRLRNSLVERSGVLPAFSRARTWRKNHTSTRAPAATKIHTGETPPLEITTVLPMEKSWREANQP